MRKAISSAFSQGTHLCFFLNNADSIHDFKRGPTAQTYGKEKLNDSQTENIITDRLKIKQNRDPQNMGPSPVSILSRQGRVLGQPNPWNAGNWIVGALIREVPIAKDLASSCPLQFAILRTFLCQPSLEETCPSWFCMQEIYP